MDPVILIFRIIVPLFIFRFPLLGGFSALWLDGTDWQVNFFNIPDIHHYYQPLDKLLDLYYLSIEAFVVFQWRSTLARRTALGLFFYRVIGIILFEITHIRLLLFLFPNIFESFFLFYLGCRTFVGKRKHLSWGLIFGSICILTMLKFIQEYTLHVQQLWQWRFIEISLFSNIFYFLYDNVYHQFYIGVVLVIIVVFFSQSHPRLRQYYITIKRLFIKDPTQNVTKDEWRKKL